MHKKENKGIEVFKENSKIAMGALQHFFMKGYIHARLWGRSKNTKYRLASKMIKEMRQYEYHPIENKVDYYKAKRMVARLDVLRRYRISFIKKAEEVTNAETGYLNAEIRKDEAERKKAALEEENKQKQEVAKAEEKLRKATEKFMEAKKLVDEKKFTTKEQKDWDTYKDVFAANIVKALQHKCSQYTNKKNQETIRQNKMEFFIKNAINPIYFKGDDGTRKKPRQPARLGQKQRPGPRRMRH